MEKGANFNTSLEDMAFGCKPCMVSTQASPVVISTNSAITAQSDLAVQVGSRIGSESVHALYAPLAVEALLCSAYRATLTTSKLVVLYTIDKCLKRYLHSGSSQHRFFGSPARFLDANQEAYVNLFHEILHKFTSAFVEILQDFRARDSTLNTNACKEAGARNTQTMWTLETEV